MIVCVGEILADLIAKETEEGIVYSRHAGGAPFNVACGVKKLGGNAEFYGSVGNDLIGKYLKEFASRRGLGAHIRSIPDRNTTLAFVDLDESGDRSFCFYRKNTADYRFDESAIGEIVEKADIVHLGSLALGEEEGRAFHDRLIAAAKRAGKRVSFDANYREDIFPDRNEALKIYGKYLAAADILKLSEEELYLFSGERGEEPAARELSKGKMLFVTLGILCGRIIYARYGRDRIGCQRRETRVRVRNTDDAEKRRDRGVPRSYGDRGISRIREAV